MMGAANTANPVEAVKAASNAPHKLQAEHFPESYYDESSSHYQGGAHNVLINLVKEGKLEGKQPEFGHEAIIKIAKDFKKGKLQASNVKLGSQKALGGAHNVAMAVLTEQANKFKKARIQESTEASATTSFFSLFGRHHRPSREQQHKNLKSTGAFVGFIIVLASCCTFYVMAKTYHDHLEKQEQLDDLMNNPNARVATGKKGKKVVDKIMAKTEDSDDEEAAIEESAPVPFKKSIDAMIKAAKAKKKQQKQEAAAQSAALSAYQAPLIIQQQPVAQAPQPVAPQPTYSYALIEPEQPKQVVAPAPAPTPAPQHQSQYWYPSFETSEPMPVPQHVMKPMRLQATQAPKAPVANLTNLPKQELIKLLLAQLAKDDIESQQ